MISNITSFTLSAMDTFLSPVGWVLSPFSRALVNREINMPFSKEEAFPPYEENYKVSCLEPTQVEAVAFRIFTGLDIKKIRESKRHLSFRIVSLNRLAKESDIPAETVAKINGEVCRMLKFEEVGVLSTLESYWVDLNMSTSVLESLNPINLQMIGRAQNKGQPNINKFVNTYQLDNESPLESRLCTRAVIRLEFDEILEDHSCWERVVFGNFHLSYNEESDSWSWEILRNQDKRERGRNVVTSIRRRLVKDAADILSEKTASINSIKELNFVKNEGYEKILQARRILLHLGWITCAISIKYISCFFF